ncbi:hypothetical protein [Streptomyces sp. H27-H5]|uniref:hypothetical protein n=1 Tax=Streptomyces sp. H27-H5 TaxID=2996460 RepID=UPI002271D773|nr:hypothetical protein [Streptomyces sp. H27-H5]MCY0961567.1 hypothetical protein [Streptomyces sp. H27-H5]
MVETIHVRGEGGAVIAMDLPLPEAIAERYASGLLVRVNADGSPHTPTREPADVDPGPGTGDGTAPDPSRPAVNAPKADWIAHVVRRGLLSADDAANYTKADLIDLAS